MAPTRMDYRFQKSQSQARINSLDLGGWRGWIRDRSSQPTHAMRLLVPSIGGLLFWIFEAWRLSYRPPLTIRDLIPLPRTRLISHQTLSGLTLYVSPEGYRCWNARLPCTPYFGRTVRLHARRTFALTSNQKGRDHNCITRTDRVGVPSLRQGLAHAFYFSTRKLPMMSASIPELKKVRMASVGVWTIASPRKLKEVFITTGTPVRLPNSSIKCQ